MDVINPGKTLFSVLFLFVVLSVSAQENSAEVLKYTTEISLKNNKLITSEYRKIKINNRNGDKYGDISIPYSDIRKLSAIDAFITDRSGKVVKKLKKSDIRNKNMFSSGSFYSENYLKEFRLSHNSYPYNLTYSYTYEERDFFYIDFWIPVISLKVPTESAELKISLPEKYKIYYKSRKLDSFKADTTNEGVDYIFRASYKKQILPEYFAEELENKLPNVIVVPEIFKFDIDGSFKTWESYGSYLYKLNSTCTLLPDSEKNRISRLIKDLSDTTEIIKKLYHDLQDRTRYINVTIETGGLKPYPAAYVCENRYGDCKALSNYFRSVLSYAGIEAHYTLVNSGDQITTIDHALPSQQFNHVILCVPVNNDTLWIDCTSDGPFAYAGTFIQNRKAFLIKETGSHFAAIPAMGMDQSLEQRNIRFKLESNDRKSAEVTYTCRGETFESLLYYTRDVSMNDKDRIIRNYYIEDGFELVDYVLNKPGRDEKEIVLKYSALADHIYQKLGKDILVKHVEFPLPIMESPSKRKMDLQFDYPINYLDTIHYPVPFNYKLAHELKDQAISSDFGSYSLQYLETAGQISIVKSLQIKVGSYSLDRYKEFYDFIDKIQGIEAAPCFLLTKRN